MQLLLPTINDDDNDKGDDHQHGAVIDPTMTMAMMAIVFLPTTQLPAIVKALILNTNSKPGLWTHILRFVPTGRKLWSLIWATASSHCATSPRHPDLFEGPWGRI